MKKTLLSLVGVAAFMCVGYAAVAAYSLLGRQFSLVEPACLYVYPTDDLAGVERKIAETAQPSCMVGFSLATKLLGLDRKQKPGRYEISPDMNLITLLHRIAIHAQNPVNLVVPSVRTVQDMAGRLSDRLMLDSAALARVLTDSAACVGLGYTKATVPALFIPNTYQVYWDVSVDDLLERMKRENAAFWTDVRREQARALGMTPVEVVTLASIVDSETANNGEKPRIAGLYLNRLKANIPLQSDPTVIFAWGDFTIRRVLRRHLDISSPYNTYRNTGLPPGPIRIPSVAGIDAVLRHEVHPYLYMCAKEDFSGTHNYAATYAEHQQNARRYAKALNARGIK